MASGPGVYVDPLTIEPVKCGPVLFLDRDGVINVDGGYVCSPAQTQWVDGIFELAWRAQELGYRILVVTNQAGIARGYYSEEAFLDYTKWIHAAFLEKRILLTATLYCPHHPTAGVGALKVVCSCRKPAPGMFEVAKARFQVDMRASALVGDKASDIEAGVAAGVGSLFYVGSAAAQISSDAVRCQSLNDVMTQLN